MKYNGLRSITRLRQLNFAYLVICVMFIVTNLWSQPLTAQVVDIPDDNFLNALIDVGVDANMDGMIQMEEALLVEAVALTDEGISSLQGIEAFINLKYIRLDDNQIEEINIPSTVRLETLLCKRNGLIRLHIADWSLMKNLDVSQNALTRIEINQPNLLSKLDIGANDDLETLIIEDASLVSDLFPHDINDVLFDTLVLYNFSETFSPRDEVRVRYYADLDQVGLKELNVLNGAGQYVSARNLPNLKIFTCHGQPSYFNWENTPLIEEISIPVIERPELTFKNLMELKEVWLSGTIDHVKFENLPQIERITTSSFSGQSVSLNNLPVLWACGFEDCGLESFEINAAPEISFLVLKNNHLTTVDVGDLTKLNRLDVSYNQISSLDLSSSTMLDYLNCQYNKLTSLDVMNNPLVTDLYASYNEITEFDLNHLMQLDELAVDYNLNKELHIMDLPNLRDCSVSSEHLERLTLFGLPNFRYHILFTAPNLRYLEFGRMEASQINGLYGSLATSSIDSLIIKEMDLPSVFIRDGASYIEVADMMQLDELVILNCDVQHIHLENLPALGSFAARDLPFFNRLDFDDIGSERLHTVNIQRTALTEIEFDKMSFNSLEQIDIQDCQLEAIDISKMFYLKNVLLQNNKLRNIEIPYSFDDYHTQYDFYNNDLQSMYIFDDIARLNYDLNPNLKYICTPAAIFETIFWRNFNYGLDSCKIDTTCQELSTYRPNLLIMNAFWKHESDIDCSETNVVPNVNYNIEDSEGIFIRKVSSSQHQTKWATNSKTVVATAIASDLFIEQPPSETFVFDSTSGGTIERDFCFVADDIHDVAITVVPEIVARPGFTHEYRIIYRNLASNVASGQIQFRYDGNLSEFESSQPIQETHIDNVLTWSYANLLPFESREILVSVRLHSPMDTPPLNGGDWVSVSGTISSDDVDAKPKNNSFGLRHQVLNSYDPNDKTCLEGPYIKEELIGDYVHYLIRCENTGTASAVNVTITDNIDKTIFDISTLEVLNASHPVVTIIEGNTVSFTFREIYLPFDDENNDGFVLFKIKTWPHLKLGDELKNEADIFFDFNFPIRTNQSLSTFGDGQSSTKDISTELDIQISPNPTADQLLVKSELPFEQVVVINSQGQVVKNLHLSQKQTILELSIRTLPPGHYSIALDAKGQQVGQFAIVR